MDIVALPTQPRTGLGKRHSAKLRKRGLIPAIVYGHKQDPVAVTLTNEDLDSVLRHHARLVELKHASGAETALIKEVQHDYLGKAVLHVDFERVDRDEKVEVEVAVELKGVIASGSQGVLDQPLHVLTVECTAAEVPESIKVIIGNLQVGQAIHVKDLVLPAGVRVLDEPDAIVVQLKTVLAEIEPETVAAAPVEGGAEPEIVGRRVKEEKEEEK